MSRIVTRGMGARLDGSGGLVTQGYAGGLVKFREFLRLCSKLGKRLKVVSRWRKDQSD